MISLYQTRGREWLASLPQKVREISALWDLDCLHPFTNLTYNYVLGGYRKGEPIVLKISLDESALEREVKALIAFENYGAVKVLEKAADALLIQGAVPGKVLKSQFPKGDLKAIQVACEVAKKLHQAPLPNDPSFPHIKEWLTVLDQDWNIPQSLLEKARTLKKHLLKIEAPFVLLHGDLHQNNILSNEKEWLVIDPKGVVGFPINEMWAFVEDPREDLVFISHYFGFNYDEVVQWYYVHLILAACWQVEDQLDPSLFLDLAKTVLSMMRD